MTVKSALPLLWIAGLGPASLAAPQTASDLESLAKDLTQQSAARQFDLIVTHFDEAMTSAMPAAKLAEFWDGLAGQMGAFQSIAGTRVQTVQGYQVVLVTSKFEKATINVKWVFDSKSRVAGFFVVPVEPDAPWTPPDYAQPGRFHEQQITVGSAPWQPPGTLTLPNGTGPFPAVVLVHGSGPHDQ